MAFSRRECCGSRRTRRVPTGSIGGWGVLPDSARAYLASLGISDPDDDAEITPGLRAWKLIWLHALAVGYSPVY
jgi:hypothetical protein